MEERLFPGPLHLWDPRVKNMVNGHLIKPVRPETGEHTT
jgi:hypothetical protein